ncbi:MAG: hypothetical protein WC692_04650 [Erythrobacter sp.]|jgi:hypothetical protein
MNDPARAIGWTPPEGRPALIREACRDRLTAPDPRAFVADMLPCNATGKILEQGLGAFFA